MLAFVCCLLIPWTCCLKSGVCLFECGNLVGDYKSCNLPEVFRKYWEVS